MAKRDAFIEHLAEVPLFAACSRKDLQQVAKRAEDVKVEAGKVLVSEGSAGAEFFVILEGQASVLQRSDTPLRAGGEYILWFHFKVETPVDMCFALACVPYVASDRDAQSAIEKALGLKPPG